MLRVGSFLCADPRRGNMLLTWCPGRTMSREKLFPIQFIEASMARIVIVYTGED